MEVKLEEGEGTLLVKARREADHVAVSVGFSDPALRSFALEQADRLRETLQQHYGTAIDLHLASDHHQQHPPSGQEQPLFPPGTLFPRRPASSLPRPAAAASDRHTGSRHGWVG